MKKSYIFVIFLFAVCFLLVAFFLNENIQQKSESISDIQRTEAMDALSMWLKQYKAFLEDRVSSEDKENKKFHHLTDYCNWVVPGETEDGIRYALFDMTGDGMPELHVLTDISYTIHTIENYQLVEWYHADRYNRPLNNGMILQNGASESGGDSYIVLDSNGMEVSCVWFGKNGNDYRFSTGGEEIKLSKNEWKKLKKPFLAIGSDKIIWKDINKLDF